MKQIEESQSGIIVISSDENDSDDHCDYTSSSDDTDFKQPPCKQPRLLRKNLESLHKDPNNITPGEDTLANVPLTTFQGTPANDNLNEEDLNDSESLSSTDMSSELSLPNNDVGDNIKKTPESKINGTVKEADGGGDIVDDDKTLCGIGNGCNGDIRQSGAK